MVKIQNSREPFYKTVLTIAVPVTLQSLLQASFSVVDQMMIGRLGSASIAGVGLGGKFSSLYTVLLGAVAAVAGIMISQYIGQKDPEEVGRSFRMNLKLAMGLAIIAAVVSICFPEQVMWLYTKDEVTRGIAAEYLRILALAFVPMAIVSILSTLLRCLEAAMFPLYASMAAAVMNTALNYRENRTAAARGERSGRRNRDLTVDGLSDDDWIWNSFLQKARDRSKAGRKNDERICRNVPEDFMPDHHL